MQLSGSKAGALWGLVATALVLCRHTEKEIRSRKEVINSAGGLCTGHYYSVERNVLFLSCMMIIYRSRQAMNARSALLSGKDIS